VQKKKPEPPSKKTWQDKTLPPKSGSTAKKTCACRGG